MFAEPLDVFFNVAEHAVSAALDGVAVAGIFDNEYADALGLATRQPRFMLKSSDAASVTQASVLVVEGSTYRVRSIEPDGTGVTLLALELQ
jgi:hypothetical protein